MHPGLSNILLVQKTDTVTYQEMLDILARCTAERAATTDPAHVQNLQTIEAHVMSIMQGLEVNMAKTMQMVRDMRVASEFFFLS